MTSIDWALLRVEAGRARGRAYAPYSGFAVGAAGIAEDGRLLTGCNVENASTGIGVCAEVTLAASMVAGGGGRLVAMAVLAGDGEPISPCGRCRQFLYEFGGDELLIDTPGGIVTLGELLPQAFGPADIEGRAG